LSGRHVIYIYIYICSCRRSDDADEAVSLPCGGYAIDNSSLSSVYSAAGPVLYNMSLSVSHTTVFTGQLVELLATAYSHASLAMPLGQFF